ncbi:MAG: ABC transporter permease [Micrococcales bacterium]
MAEKKVEEQEETRLKKIAKSAVRRYSLLMLWVVMVAVLVVVVPDGVNPIDAMRAVLSQQTPVIFLGLGVVITMAVGEFDLSFAGIFGISAVAVPSLVIFNGWSYPMAVIAALVIALICGLINGLLVVKVKINSVVVTLGVSSVAGGLGYWLSNETTVSGLDPNLAAVAIGKFLGLPMLFWYGVVLSAIVAYIMSGTPLGRNMLFVGSNRAVASLAGISVSRVRIGAYLASSLLAGLAGVILATGLGGYNPGTAATNLMPTFAAVFLGTVAVVPGRFNPIGMLIAAYFLLTGVFGLQLLGLSGWVTQVFYGVVLVAAVTVSTVIQRRIKS